MRVIVTGGRNYGVHNKETDSPERHDQARKERQYLFRTLTKIHETTPITFLAEGGANGVDYWAKMWREWKSVPGETWEANWALGKVAGHIRNGVMLREAKPDLVIAFPGGRGTDNCVKQAREKEIEVLDKRTVRDY